MMIRKAQLADIPALDTLVNSAYRGNSSRQGWTTEADLLDGIRTDREALVQMLQEPGTTILVHYTESGRLTGCVYLKNKGTSLYLGMLTVAPTEQNQGLGKKMLTAAEQQARTEGCTSIRMTVISVRAELIAWYERHGYRATGETEPFPDDPRFGIPKQKLQFIVLEKPLA
jgi:predicted N-acetyltransferase YhbS